MQTDVVSSGSDTSSHSFKIVLLCASPLGAANSGGKAVADRDFFIFGFNASNSSERKLAHAISNSF